MGCGMSLCCKPTGTSFLESSRSRLFKPSAISIAAAGNGYRDQLNEEGETIDDFDKELQQLNDEVRGGEDMSPPPTLDESMSDNDTSLTKIAAVVTSKMRESPQSAMYLSTSRMDIDDAPEIPNSEDTKEAIDAFTSETLQEDALDLKLDASSDSIMEVLDEKPPEVLAQSIASEDLGEPETTLVATEETSNVAHAPSDSDEIDGTIHVEAQEEAVRSEEDFSQENTEEDKEIIAEMVDAVNSPTPQAEISVNEELLNSSPLEDLSEAKETMVDYAENTEIVIDQIEELETAALELADSVKNDDDTPNVIDIPMDADGMEENVELELCETVNEIDAVENELQEIIDEELPQGIGGNISETSKIEEDLSHENAEEDEQTLEKTVDVVDSPTPQAEEEPSENMEILNSGELEAETEADCVEDQDIVLPSSSDLEEACPVEIDESNQLDTEETGSMSAEGESNVAQEQDQKVEPSESSYPEEQIQEEDDAIEDGEREEENHSKIMDTQDEKPDDDKKEIDEIQRSVSEAEGIEISDIVDEQPSQIENIEEILTEIENGDVTKDPEASELQDDGDLPQDASLIEDKAPSIHANEDSFLEVENNEQDDGFSQDLEINDNVDGDANETANDAEDAVHSSHDEHHEEGVENLEQNDGLPTAAADENDDQFPNPDLENATIALDRTLEVEDTDNEKDNSSTDALLQNEHTPDIDVEEEGKISADNETDEFEILNLILGVPCEENSIQEDNRSICLTDTTAEDGSGLNAPSLTENVTESESAVNEEAEPNDTTNFSDTEENHDSHAESDDAQRIPDLKANALLDEDFNELLYEGDKEVSNDDEEEIWSKLQKDLQLEEEEQQTLAAIKIQSTFRGYKSRKEFNHTLENKNETEDDNNPVIDDVENVLEDEVSTLAYAPEEPLESNDYGNGLTGALAGVTESIATVALIMTDTPQHQPPLLSTEEDQHDEVLDANLGNENATDTSHAFPDNQREVHDVAEEPMSNGEEIRDIQLIESYVITSSVADSTSLASPEVTNIENSKEDGSNKVNDDTVSEIGPAEAEAVDSDPGVVFELYVESNETINDGLLESYCLHREDSAKESSQNELDSCLYERENVAATKIQAGFRGQQDRKRVRDLKNEVAENVAATKIQAGFRGQQDRKRVRDLKNDIAENVAATKIQAGFRGQQDRKRVRNLKNDIAENVSSTRILERENAAATTIQAGFRGHQDRKRIKDRAAGIGGTEQTNLIINEEKSHLNDGESIHHLQPSQCSLELENAAATKIQASYRGHQDRKRVKQLQHQIDENAVTENDKQSIHPANQTNVGEDLQNVCLEELENAAATKIQAGFRGYQERKHIRHLKNHALPNDSLNEKETNFPEKNDLFDSHDYIPHMGQKLLDEENAAATKIQAGFRGHQDRKRVKGLKDSVTKQDDVVRDAASYKEETSLLDYDQPAESIQVDLENIAATKIQAGFRGHQDRKRVKNLQRHKTESNVGSERVDTTNGGTDTTLTTDQLNEEQSQENERENAAATKIQSSFRGHQDRKKIKHLKNRATQNDLIDEKETILEEENNLLDLGEHTHEVGRNSLEEENAAATKIQAGFRGHQDTKRVKFLKDSAIKSGDVDSAGCDEEASFLDYDQTADSIQVDLENTAATKIQAGFRGHQDRKRVKNLQRRVTESDIGNDKEKCAGTIPTPDKPNVEQSQETPCLNELENAAATKIQASYRGHQDRKKIKHLKNRAASNDMINQKETIFVEENSLIDRGEHVHDTRRNSLGEENAAATKIQAGFRGNQDRKRVKFLKDSAVKSDIVDGGTASSPEESQAADLIQIGLENTAATKIQAGFRGHQDRKRVKDLQRRTTESHVENDKDKCIDTIPTPDQSNVEQSQENLCLDELENAAATKIQAGFRGYQERKNIKHLKNQTISNDLMNEKEIADDDELIQHIGRKRNSLEEENFAAIKIQAGFRGQQDRKRVKYLKDSIVKSDVNDNGCARHNEIPPFENDQTTEAIQVDVENIAATKIQAGFRGHQDRKRLKHLRNSTDVV